jgi:hypothetical protein
MLSIHRLYVARFVFKKSFHFIIESDEFFKNNKMQGIGASGEG